MKLNDLRDEIFNLAAEQGFHGGKQDDLCRKLMLVNSELCEAMEAERNGIIPKRLGDQSNYPIPSSEQFSQSCRGSIEEEIADAVIRLADIAGMIDMDLEWWVRAKMAYNHARPYKHSKEY